MIGLDSYSRQVFIYLDPIFIYISVLNRLPIKNSQNCSCFLWLSLPGDYRVTDEALLAETAWYDPPSSLRMFSLLLKDLISDFYLTHISIASHFWDRQTVTPQNAASDQGLHCLLIGISACI